VGEIGGRSFGKLDLGFETEYQTRLEMEVTVIESKVLYGFR
jgi:hypothetical protein